MIHVGDCRAVLPRLPGGSAHCCVTSPPYFGLRDYGHDGQIGLEQTPAEYVEQMVAVFRDVRRVLRDDGTLWLNLGDSYATRWSSARGEGRAGMSDNERDRHGPPPAGFKNKDLIGIPWRVAFALHGCPPGGVVLDPFAGSGTTAEVALRNGRQFLGIELNPDYRPLQIERITNALAAA